LNLGERSFSLIMLMAIALFAVVIIMLPGKPGRQASAYDNNTVPTQSPGTASIPEYIIPLDSEIRLPIASTFVFKVKMNFSETLNGSVLEVGGTCFTFNVLDEEAYLFYVRNGPGSISRTKGRVYVSANPVHSKMKFSVVADRTGDYYFILMSPAGTCHGKVISIKLDT
jgi:hypothetical protein